uniref:Uncharacterized protein n=1 Tax=Eutreptiella gymnastica TaxID=73025 RepID=A0A7S4CAV9_9EUGL
MDIVKGHGSLAVHSAQPSRAPAASFVYPGPAEDRLQVPMELNAPTPTVHGPRTTSSRLLASVSGSSEMKRRFVSAHCFAPQFSFGPLGPTLREAYQVCEVMDGTAESVNKGLAAPRVRKGLHRV